MKPNSRPKPTIKPDLDRNLTLHDLHGIMSGQINALLAGKTSPVNVNAMCNASGKIISIVKLHIEYAKMTGASLPADPFKGPKQLV